MEVVAFVDEGLGNSSYLVDVGDGNAVVVDPSRDPRPYMDAASRRGLRITHALETHLHADFVSGSRELGVTVVASAEAKLAFDHHGMRDDDELEIGGGLTLRALATPGHTPEHLSFVLSDGARPRALFSGGALIVGSIARTDLVSADQTEALTRAAYRSVRERLGPLPDELVVYPTHGAGSFCSTVAGNDRVTTIVRERATNPAFTEGCEDAFVRHTIGAFGSFPPYFLRLREFNRRGPQVFGGDRPSLPSLDVDDVTRALDDGVVLIDVRPIDRFATGHIEGSLSIELRPVFATWLGWLVPDNAQLVFVIDPDQDADDLVQQCLKVGYEDLRGSLAGGIPAWTSDIASIPLRHPTEIEGAIVDIRQSGELGDGRIPGSVHVELADVTTRDLPDGPLTLHCGHGERAMTAASLLERSGRDDLFVMLGGPTEWRATTGHALV